MRPRILHTRGYPDRQRGAIVIAASVAILVCIALLASADIGYLYYMKREFQKSADLAALAGAQQLPNACAEGASSPTSAANANATANLRVHDFSSAPTVTVNCGIWSSTAPSAPVGSPGGRYFLARGAAASVNAVQVLISGNAPAFLPLISSRVVRAGAVAVREQPTAVISTGSELASLKMAGLTASVLSAEGGARITLDGLLGRLGIKVDADIGVADLNALLAANKISVGALIDAAASALPSSGAALSVELSALKQSLKTNGALDAVQVQLGGANSPISLFTGVGSAASQDSASLARAALHTELKVSDLVSTAISIANAGNAVAVSGLNILGLQAQAAIVSPPSVAAGPVGTTARQAQVRLHLDIDTNKMPLLGLVTGVLGVRVHLPIFIDLVRGSARINAISCNTDPRTVNVLLTQSVVGACVGKVADARRFAAAGLCEAATPADLQPEVLLKLFKDDLLTTTLRIDALSGTQVMLGMTAGETRTISNNLAVGDALSNIASVLTSTLSKLASPPGTPSALATAAAKTYLAQASKDSFQRYQLEPLISLLQNGSANGSLPPLGSWTTNAKGDKFSVPYACGLLGLGTCTADGSVWDSFRATVNGAGGAVGGLLGTVLGGLVVNNCNNLITGLFNTYNNCIESNLVAYLQSKPGGVVSAPTTGPCSTLLCATVAPVTAAVAPLLNLIGSTLKGTLATGLGLELDKTSVTVHAISCGNVRLVH